MTPLLWEDRAYNEDGGEEEEEAAAEGETFCALPPSLPPPPFKKTGKVRLWGGRGGRGDDSGAEKDMEGTLYHTSRGAQLWEEEDGREEGERGEKVGLGREGRRRKEKGKGERENPKRNRAGPLPTDGWWSSLSPSFSSFSAHFISPSECRLKINATKEESENNKFT